MSIRQRIAQWIVRNAWDSSEVKKGTAAWTEMFGAMPNGLPAPTETSALTVSAINACVFLLCGCAASVPANLYRVDANGFREEIHGDDMWWMLNEEMAPRWSAAVAWEFLMASLLLHGNSYAVILRDVMGKPIGLDPIHPLRVEPILDGARSRLVYRVSPDLYAINAPAQIRVIDQDDMIHVAGLGFDGIKGLSPLRYALRTAAGVALATQDFAGTFFANSARPDYVLKADKPLGVEALDKLRASLNERHQGGANAHLPMILQGGMEFQSISMPLEDLQLMSIRQFQVEEIARIFGVPPFMIGHNEKTTSWGSGVEAMGIGFVRYTLRPYLNKIENEFNRKLIRKSPRLIAFDTEDLERADMKSLYDSLRAGLGRAGERQIMSVNEARRKLRLKPAPDGDKIETSAVPAAAAPSQTDSNNAQP
jgi:HK97 family phage portal protein